MNVYNVYLDDGRREPYEYITHLSLDHLGKQVMRDGILLKHIAGTYFWVAPHRIYCIRHADNNIT